SWNDEGSLIANLTAAETQFERPTYRATRIGISYQDGIRTRFSRRDGWSSNWLILLVNNHAIWSSPTKGVISTARIRSRNQLGLMLSTLVVGDQICHVRHGR